MRYLIKSNIARTIMLCFILSLTVLISISYAAFIGAGYKKGVISTTPVGIRFSSNYLEITGNGSEAKEYKVSIPIGDEENTNIIFNLDIANVAQKDPFNPSEYDITYDLEIAIKPNQDRQAITGPFYINDEKISENTGVFKTIILNQKLEAGEVNTNDYAISIPYDEIGNVEMTIKAIPDEDSMNALGNIVLARKLTFSTYIAGQSSNFVWKGRIIEGANSKENSALNYELTGFGKGKVTLSWDNSKFEIDPFFLAEWETATGSKIIKSEEKNSIIIDVDSTVIGYYQIQFYRIAQIADDENIGLYFSIFAEEA